MSKLGVCVLLTPANASAADRSSISEAFHRDEIALRDTLADLYQRLELLRIVPTLQGFHIREFVDNNSWSSPLAFENFKIFRSSG